MPRGVASKDGDTNVSQNGYHYTRVDGKFRLTHHLVAESILGRRLEDDETVSFRDGDRTNLTPSNIKVSKKRISTKAKIAAIEAQIMELMAKRDKLVAQYENEQKVKQALKAKETKK